MATPAARQLEQLRRLRDDPDYYIPRLLKIKTKEPGAPLRLLVPNQAQRKFFAKVKELRTAGQPVRILVPKARQLGISTGTEGLIFQNTATHRNISSLIVAHEDEPATSLFEMSRLFYDELPAAFKPMKRYSNRAELWFENPREWERKTKPGLRSRIRVATARNLKIGRGKTIHNVHLSEMAFYPDAKTLLAGLMNTVPNRPGTMIIGESTGNGVGGYWYELVMAARDRENEWTLMFFPWFEDPGYRMSREEGAAYLDNGRLKLDEEERSLRNAFGLDDEQFIWRRWAIQNLCGGDLAIFHQEYPASLEEGFIASGRPVFEMVRLQVLLHGCTPGDRYLIQWGLDGTGQIIRDGVGELEVWQTPQPDRRYILAADVAEGLPEGDYSVGEVLDEETGEQVAELRGHWEDHIFGRMLDAVGRWYNLALIGPERNNQGHSVLNTLVNQCHYPNVYYHDDWDQAPGTNLQRPGWPTDGQTRPILVSGLQEAVREKWWRVHSKTLVGEMMTFVRNAKGKPQAQGKGTAGGCKDDTVMASGIGLQLRARRLVAPATATTLNSGMRR